MPYKDPIKAKEYDDKYRLKWRLKNRDKIKQYKNKYLSNLSEEQKVKLKQYRDKYNHECYRKEGTCECGEKFIGGKKRKYCDKCLSNLLKNNQNYKLVNPKNRPRGENHPMWKGGITFWRKTIWDSRKYSDWRKAVFNRDNYTCQKCNIKNGNGKTIKLEAHHTPIGFADLLRKYKITSKAEADICEEIWDISLGQTLCIDCHQLTKKGNQKLKKL